MTLHEEYFEWIYQLIEGKGYRKTLEHLYNVPFYAIMPLDDNRLRDGINLAYKFANECGYPDEEIEYNLDMNICSVLEVMVGLAVRIEDTLMADEDFGDRTIMWFWIMMKSLGLYGMTDDKYDHRRVQDVIIRFLEREYEPNGRGGLFTIHNTTKDLRDIEIWYQMCMFFDNLL